MGFRLRCALLLLTAFLTGASELRAHAVEGANLQLIAELTEEKLIYEISAETSLVPPLEHVKYGTESFPSTDELRETLVRYFSENCPVLIDGIAVTPVLEDIQFDALENQVNLGAVENFVMAYIFLNYPVKSRPQKAEMTWNVFLPDQVNELVPQTPDPTGHTPQTLDSIFYTFGELDLMRFSPEEPQYIWHNPKPILSIDAQKRLELAEAQRRTRSLPLSWPIALVLLIFAILAQVKRRPRLALGLVTASIATAFATSFLTIEFKSTAEDLDGIAALQRFKDLHQNIYRAFDYDTDEAIYDTLSQSVEGDLLDKIYSDVYRSLVLRDEGGAVCRVKRLEYLDCLPVSSPEQAPSGPRYAFDAHWRVHGLVQHWGHTHERVNEYQARYQMAPSEGLWKIQEVAINQEKRLHPQTLEAVN